ncbi:MAG: ATP-binding protein [Tannerella sp.]|jgi:DNA replication protein DnaC|nr:ATP-binding protein [Tannerella sp.]
MSEGVQKLIDSLIQGRIKASVEKQREEARKKNEWEALPEETRIEISSRREKEYQEQEERWLENRKQAQIREWQQRGITPRYFQATWKNWIAETPEQNQALKTITQNAWEKNLFLVGGNGTGKTHLAMCLAKDGATYCLLPELFRAVRHDLDSEQEIIDRYSSCKLLILDEIGRQKGTDFERNLLFEIIDNRWNNLLPTTIIGNLNQEELVKICGAAILDRLNPIIVKFVWKSKRR